MNFQASYIIDGISDLINNEFHNRSFFNRRIKNPKVDALKGLLENAYYDVRDRCSRLLGHLRALETTLKAVTAV